MAFRRGFRKGRRDKVQISDSAGTDQKDHIASCNIWSRGTSWVLGLVTTSSAAA